MTDDEAGARFQIRNRRSATRIEGETPAEESAQVLVDEPAAEESAEEPAPAVPQAGAGGQVWLWALCALGVVAVAWAVWSWRAADDDPDRARADLRDSAVIEGTAAVETMNTMDYRDVPAGIEAWRDVTTGVLHDQLVAIGTEEQELLAEQGKVATGRVVQAALTELDDRTATLIAAVEVTVSDGTDDGADDGVDEGADDDAGDGADEGAEDGGEGEDADPTVKRNRFAAELVLVNGQWKLENLAQVAVGT